MDASSLSKLWKVLGSILAYYSANAWLQDRGTGQLFKMMLLDSRPIPNAYFSIIIIGGFLTLVCAIGAAYARLQSSRSWTERVPVVLIDNLRFGTRAAHLYQSATLFLFVVFPTACLLHMVNQLYRHGALFPNVTVTLAQQDKCPSGLRQNRDGKCAPPIFRLREGWGFARPLFADSDYCLMAWQTGYVRLRSRLESPHAGQPNANEGVDANSPQHNPCRDIPDREWFGGVTWLPVLSPILLSFLVATALLSVAVFIRRLSSRIDQD